MSGNGENLGSDLARMDSHEIQAEEYEELPELADADLQSSELVWRVGEKSVSAEEGKAAFSFCSKKGQD